MSTLLTTENLAKRFRGVEALSGLTMDVPEGAVFALVGPNGAGKSTWRQLPARATPFQAYRNENVKSGPTVRNRPVK